MSETGEARGSNRWVVVIVVAIALAMLLCSCVAVLAAGWWLGGGGGWRWWRTSPWSDSKIAERQVEASREVERVLAVDVPLRAEIHGDVGPIEIVGTDGEQVSVRAVVRAWGSSSRLAQEAADEVQVEIVQRDSDFIRVVGRNPRRSYRKSPSVVLKLLVPRRCEVEATSNVGNLTVEGIQGSVDLRVNVGSIEVRDLRLIDDSRLSTNVGKIEISLSGTSRFRLDARTSVGGIDCDFDVQGPRERRVGPSDRLRGAVGKDPGVRLRLRTNTGGISIRKAR